MNRIITSFLVLLCGAGVYAEGAGCDMNQYDEALCKDTMDRLRNNITFNQDMIDLHQRSRKWCKDMIEFYQRSIEQYKQIINRSKQLIDVTKNIIERYQRLIEQYTQKINEFKETIEEFNERLKIHNGIIGTAQKQIDDDKDKILQYKQVAERMKAQQQGAPSTPEDAYSILGRQSVDEIRHQYRQLAKE